jgi:DnaJ-class molecular chaperone
MTDTDNKQSHGEDAPPYRESVERCGSCKGRGRSRLLLRIGGKEVFTDGSLCRNCEGTGNELSWYEHFSCTPDF